VPQLPAKRRGGDKFAREGFVTDADWEGCPWDPEHRDRLTLSKQTCLHINHEGSKKKREAQEKKEKKLKKKKSKKRPKRRRRRRKGFESLLVFDLNRTC